MSKINISNEINIFFRENSERCNTNQIQTLVLKKNVAIDQSLKSVFSFYHNIIRSNEEGILTDNNPEFLHKFRVNIRKTRSILKQFKKYINEEILEFADEFSAIAKATNKLRDIDVYLIKRGKYLSMLPEHLHSGLEIFFGDLRQQRKYHRRKVRNLISSPEYNEIQKKWTMMYSGDKEIFSKKVEYSIKVLVAKLIFKRFNKILRKGRKISDESTDRDMHKLRIECKKLRYLLEAFSSLFSSKKIDKVMEDLKGLQDALGNFNDTCFQSEFIKKCLTKKRKDPEASSLYITSLAGLLGALHHHKKLYRTSFFESFNIFQNQENLDLYNNLFGKI